VGPVVVDPRAPVLVVGVELAGVVVVVVVVVWAPLVVVVATGSAVTV
jgi:hypothetical protein